MRSSEGIWRGFWLGLLVYAAIVYAVYLAWPS